MPVTQRFLKRSLRSSIKEEILPGEVNINDLFDLLLDFSEVKEEQTNYRCLLPNVSLLRCLSKQTQGGYFMIDTSPKTSSTRFMYVFNCLSTWRAQMIEPEVGGRSQM